jgi:hypothetical protein
MTGAAGSNARGSRPAGAPINAKGEPWGILRHTSLNRPEFKPERAVLYPTSYRITTEESMVHLRAWGATELGKSTPDFVVSYQMPRNGPTRAMLHFGSRESADSFETWLKNYRYILSDIDLETDTFADLPNGTHALTYVDCPFFEDETMPIQILAWISENCTKPFYFTHGKLAFAGQDEAFAFQMRFKGVKI